MSYCGKCVYYLTDQDDEGNVTIFHYADGRAEGFCAIQDLFTDVKADTPACKQFQEVQEFEQVSEH